jgi:penicillin amidase
LAAVFPEAAALLNPPAVALGGDGDTLYSAGFAPAQGFGVTLTSVARYVFDPGDWSQSRWVVPLGASGHPGSPHHHDQLAHWATDRLLPMRYDWTEIERCAETRQDVVPMRAASAMTTGSR